MRSATPEMLEREWFLGTDPCVRGTPVAPRPRVTTPVPPAFWLYLTQDAQRARPRACRILERVPVDRGEGYRVELDPPLPGTFFGLRRDLREVVLGPRAAAGIDGSDGASTEIPVDVFAPVEGARPALRLLEWGRVRLAPRAPRPR